MNHKLTKKAAVPFLRGAGPPSSPPASFLLATKKAMQTTAHTENTVTLKDRSPAGTMNAPPGYISWRCRGICFFQSSVTPTEFQYTAAIVHGKPRPRKTFTLLLPVTLPMEASAFESPLAAAIEAKVSGSEVPRATKVMAVMEGGHSITQPKKAARSPIKAVTPQMKMSATMKHTQPPAKSVGGTHAKSTLEDGEYV